MRPRQLVPTLKLDPLQTAVVPGDTHNVLQPEFDSILPYKTTALTSKHKFTPRKKKNEDTMEKDEEENKS